MSKTNYEKHFGTPEDAVVTISHIIQDHKRDDCEHCILGDQETGKCLGDSQVSLLKYMQEECNE